MRISKTFDYAYVCLFSIHYIVLYQNMYCVKPHIFAKRSSMFLAVHMSAEHDL